MSEWKSVDDCLPATNLKVIVALKPYGRWLRTVAVYIPALTVPEDQFMSDEYHGEGDYVEEKDEYFTPEGWYEGNIDAETNWKISNVQFWQPFPELPAGCA